MTRVTRNCLTCGVEFTAKVSAVRPNPLYCSKHCHNIDRKRKCAELNADDREALMAKAREATRGMKHTDEHRNKIARTRQDTVALSGDEAEIMSAFVSAGLHPIPLYAIHRYNIDFAFPEHQLAVEYNGGNWHNTPKKRAADEVKADYLATHGWRLMVFDRIEKPRTNNSGNRRIAINEIVERVATELGLSERS